jgi:uncharacterized membrane protein
MKIRNANHVYTSLLDNSEKFAIWITDRVGTIGFFAIIFLWTICWLSWNMFAPKDMRFDPYPAFVLWLFMSNMIQIFLMPLIMVGQNLQAKHAEIRAETDFEVNTKAEKEIEDIKQELEEIKDILQKLLSNRTQ